MAAIAIEPSDPTFDPPSDASSPFWRRPILLCMPRPSRVLAPSPVLQFPRELVAVECLISQQRSYTVAKKTKKVKKKVKKAKKK